MDKQRLQELAGVLTEAKKDPIVQMAEMFERLVHQAEKDGEIEQGSENWHEYASDLMNALHEELRNRGIMA